MDLLSLLATLTLDASNYTKGMQEAQDTADGFKMPEDSKLEVDTEDFNDDLDQAGKNVNIFQEVANGAWQGIKDGLKAAGIAATIAGLARGIATTVRRSAELGDAVDKGSKRLSMSTKAYQEFDYALKLSGASINDLSIGMQRFDSIVGYGATDDQRKKFEELGISVDEAVSAEQLMLDTLKAIADADPSKQGALLGYFFGDRNGKNLKALIEDGSEGIEQLMNQAHEYGAVMSDEQVENSARFLDTITQLETKIQGLKNDFANVLLPVITGAVDGIMKIIAFFGGSGEKGLSDQFKETDKEMNKELITIEATSQAAMEMVEKLYAMGDAEKLTAEQQAEWKQTAEWLINNIPSLSDQIDLDTLSINTNKDAIAENIEQWRKLSTERAIAAAKESKYKAMLEGNAEAIDKQATARAKSNEATQKEYEAITEANNLLKNNSQLSERFSAAFGTTEITKGAENYAKMIEWLRSVGYEFADTSSFQDVYEEYIKIDNEQRKAAEEAQKFSAQLESAQAEYEAWCVAVEEMYGVTESQATDATGDVNALDAAVQSATNSVRALAVAMGGVNPFGGFTKLPGRAVGDAYVPYDMPVMVHRGETIRTATQTRRDEQSVNVANLEDRIIRAIQTGMANASVNSYLNGKDITDNVNRNMIRELKARRFTK